MIYGIVLASGKGERFKEEIPKQFVKLAGRTVVEHTVSTLEHHSGISAIIIVTLKEYVPKIEEMVLRNKWRKVIKILVGGKTRQESSYIGVNAIDDEEALVLIHDAVRPLLSYRIIDDVIEALHTHNAVDVAIPSTDTIIRIDENSLIEEIPSRTFLWRGQTPQGFRLSVIKKAHQLAMKDKFTQVTDDCGLVLHYNLSEIYVVKGDDYNIKITTPIDIYLADKLFQLKTLSNLRSNYKILRDKVLVVFGASRGIGREIINLSKSIGLKAHGFSRSSGVDVRNIRNIQEALRKVEEKEGKINYVVVTAGILRKRPLVFFSESEIREQIETNYLGNVNVAVQAYPYLKETQGGMVFFASSSYTRGRSFYSIYSSTKATVVNLMQALSEEWYEDGIKVNVICPERTATPMRFENFGKEPLESLLDPVVVARKTLEVLSTDITGQIVEVRKS